MRYWNFLVAGHYVNVAARDVDTARGYAIQEAIRTHGVSLAEAFTAARWLP